MKNIFKKILIVISTLLILLLVLMFAMGKSYHFEKSIIINASPEEVYQHVNSSKKFNHWNPWFDLDPNINVEYSGEDGKVGEQYCWKGNDKVGEGCHQILSLVPDQIVKTKMMFKKPFESDGYSDIIVSKDGNSSKVTWTLDCELDYPMNLMKLMMDQGMDDSYSKGLSKLKTLVEKK